MFELKFLLMVYCFFVFVMAESYYRKLPDKSDGKDYDKKKRARGIIFLPLIMWILPAQHLYRLVRSLIKDAFGKEE